MKRKTKLLALLSVLAALCVMTLIAGQITVDPTTEEETQEEEDTSVTVASVSAADVTNLAIETDSKTLTLSCTDGEWMNAQDLDFPIDGEAVTAMLESLSDVTASRKIDEPEALSEYGLDAPETTVELTLADGTTQTFAFGNQNSLTSETYLSYSGEDGAVYLVSSSLESAFTSDPYDLVAMESLPEFGDVLSLSASRADDYAFTLDRREDGQALDPQAVWFLEKSGQTCAVDTNAAQSLIANVTGLSWLSCANAHATSEEMDTYGLSDAYTAVTLSYTDADGATQSFALRIGADATSGTYACLEGSDMVYLISTDTADALRYVTYASLRSDLVCPIDFDAVEQIDVTLDGETLSITATQAQTATPEEATAEESEETGDDSATDGSATDEAGTQVTYTAQDRTLDADTMQSLIDELSALTATGETGTPDTDCPLIAFTFHRPQQNAVSLTLYAFDSDSCLTSIDGETCLLVSREDAQALVDLARSLMTPDAE